MLERYRRFSSDDYEGCPGCQWKGCSECDGTGWVRKDPAAVTGISNTPSPRPEDPSAAPIHWVGKWAVDGEDKLAKLASGTPLRDYATDAEVEFYKEILRLRQLLTEGTP